MKMFSMSTGMKSLRIYGEKPFTTAVIHGGPGAPGEMSPVARELATDYGVIEPLQTASLIEGQVSELRVALEKNAVARFCAVLRTEVR